MIVQNYAFFLIYANLICIYAYFFVILRPIWFLYMVKHIRTYILGMVLLSGIVSVWADASAEMIEIKPTKKVIHVDQLGMADNTCVLDVLQIMPELLNRGKDFLLSNYSIQLDGKDVGRSRDVVLSQTLITEVSTIEISQSPTASEQKNGQSGVVNIKLKSLEQGFHGDVMLSGSTDWDVMPSVMLNYRKDNWQLYTSLRCEYYNNYSYEVNYQTEPGYRYTHYDTIHSRFRQQTAKAYLKYKDGHDEFNLHVLETSEFTDYQELLWGEKSTQITPSSYLMHTGTDVRESQSMDLSVAVNTEYVHTFTGNHELGVEFNYNYAPNHSQVASYYDQELQMLFGAVSRSYQINDVPYSHAMNGDIHSKQFVYKHDERHELSFKEGVNVEYSKTRSTDVDSSYNVTQPDPTIRYSCTNDITTLYASPYAQVDWIHGAWYLQFSARYLFHQYQMQELEDALSATDAHNWTANLSVDWQAAKNHNLRLVAARNLLSPTAKQLYPYVLYNRVTGVAVVGNPALREVPVYNCQLNYIYNYHQGEHYLTTDCGLEYIYANGLIKSVSRFDEQYHMNYNTFDNIGTDHIINLNASLIYRYKFFSMAFTGNLFENRHEESMNVSHHFYYNLALTPVFSFRHDWTLAGKMMYNSPIQTANERKGDCFYMQVSLSKRLGNWNLFAQINDVMGYVVQDVSWSGDSCTERWYDLYDQAFMIGFDYKF